MAYSSAVLPINALNVQEEVELEESEIKQFSFSNQNADKHFEGGDDFNSGAISSYKNHNYWGFSLKEICNQQQKGNFNNKDLYLLFCSLKIHFC